MSNKDIFEHFKEEAEKLREAPSPETWLRIEHRLQTNRPSIQRTRIKILGPHLHPMSLAAGIALILGLAVVFLWMTDSQKAKAPIAQAATLEWEELSLAPTDESSSEVIAIAASNPKPVALKPIEEGSPNQRLVAKQELRVRSDIHNNPPDSARNVRGESK